MTERLDSQSPADKPSVSLPDHEEVKRRAMWLEQVCCEESLLLGPSNRATVRGIAKLLRELSTARSAGTRRYTIEELEAYHTAFENTRRDYHRHGNHEGQRACEFALEAIRLYQMGTPQSARTPITDAMVEAACAEAHGPAWRKVYSLDYENTIKADMRRALEAAANATDATTDRKAHD